MVEKEKDMVDAVPWLRDLAERGGKGVVNNIDARALGRVADEIERLREAIKLAGYDGITESGLLFRRLGQERGKEIVVGDHLIGKQKAFVKY